MPNTLKRGGQRLSAGESEGKPIVVAASLHRESHRVTYKAS
jgi:hypothetical protein